MRWVRPRRDPTRARAPPAAPPPLADPALEARLRASYDALPAAAQRRLPVGVVVQARLGAPLRVVLTDAEVGGRGEGARGWPG